MKKKMTRREVKKVLATFALKQAYARVEGKYGCAINGNRPLDIASFIRFAQTKEAHGTFEEMVESYLTSPKGSLRFDKTEKHRKEREIAKAKILEEFGFADDSNTLKQSMVFDDCESDDTDNDNCLDFDECRSFNLPMAKYRGNYFLICDYPGVDWAHAVRIGSSPKFDDKYSCVLLKIGHGIDVGMVRATDKVECSDLVRISHTGIFEIINV